MKSVMISIKPKWCELIASGKKTVEVRKTRPKIATPFKCYIYCTQDFADSRTKRKRNEFWIGEPLNNVSKGRCIGNGMVIGEFVCSKIKYISPSYGYVDARCIAAEGYILDKCCLTAKELVEYGKGKDVYGWHISDLVIYDKPKELSDFSSGSSTLSFSKTKDGFPWKYSGMIRPPQSWCYCEEAEK